MIFLVQTTVVQTFVQHFGARDHHGHETKVKRDNGLINFMKMTFFMPRTREYRLNKNIIIHIVIYEHVSNKSLVIERVR